MSDEKKESTKASGLENSAIQSDPDKISPEKDHSIEKLKADLRKYPTRPYLGIGAVIIFDNRLLLVKRRFEPDKDLWTIPGGHLELGENSKECAERETLEETGVKIKALDIAGNCAIDKIMYDEKGQLMYHYVLINYNTQIIDERFKQGIPVLEAKSDAADIAFVPFSELKNYQLSNSLIDLLRIMKII
jgi:8-oxo-dGTP diphosphatase